MKRQRRTDLYISPQILVFYFDFTQHTPDLFGELAALLKDDRAAPFALDAETLSVVDGFFVEEAEIAAFDRRTFVAATD